MDFERKRLAARHACACLADETFAMIKKGQCISMYIRITDCFVYPLHFLHMFRRNDVYPASSTDVYPCISLYIRFSIKIQFRSFGCSSWPALSYSIRLALSSDGVGCQGRCQGHRGQRPEAASKDDDEEGSVIKVINGIMCHSKAPPIWKTQPFDYDEPCPKSGRQRRHGCCD